MGNTKELQNQFPYKTIEELVASVGLGEISLQRVLRHLIDEKEILETQVPFSRAPLPSPKETYAAIRISEQKGIKARLAQCCKPIPSEPIIAYIAVQTGATVHKKNCRNIGPEHESEGENPRILPAYWGKGAKTQTTPVNLEVRAYDRVGLLQDISTTISGQGVNMVSINAQAPKDATTVLSLTVEVRSLDQLQALIRKIKAVSDINRVQRV